MYKLRVYIYSNHVPFGARQKSYEFTSLIKFGSCQKNFEIPISVWLFKSHAKSCFFCWTSFWKYWVMRKVILCRNSFGNMEEYSREAYVPSRITTNASKAKRSAEQPIRANYASQSSWVHAKRAPYGCEPITVYVRKANQAWSVPAKRASRVRELIVV